MKHLFLLAGACLASALGFAQSTTNYKPGYLVTMQGDTLRGEVEIPAFHRKTAFLYVPLALPLLVKRIYLAPYVVCS